MNNEQIQPQAETVQDPQVQQPVFAVPDAEKALKPTAEMQIMEEQSFSVLKSKGLKADILQYSPHNNLEDMLKGAEVLIASGLLPNKFTEPEQVVVAMKMGSEFDIPPMVAINNIHVIEGKPTFNVHIVGSLMLRGGWTYKMLEDFADIGNNNYRTTIQFTDLNALKRWDAHIKDTMKYPEDIRAALLEVSRELKETVHRTFSFTWLEAYQMGLTEKSNWKKMGLVMMRSRCLTLGSRFVAPALMNGMVETSEWNDVKNLEYTVDAEGIVIE